MNTTIAAITCTIVNPSQTSGSGAPATQLERN